MSDIPWLSLSPTSGTTPADDSTVVDVSTDSTGLLPGTRTANLCANSNDPVTPLVEVPVDMTVVNVPPEVAVDPVSQQAQYSDEISPVTITATDNIAEVLTADTSWSTDGGAFYPGLPDYLALSGPSCIDGGGGMQECTWTISGAMDLSEAVYTIRTAVSDNYGGVTIADAVINVLAEDATVAFDSGNPVAVQVATPDGDSDPFSLTVYVTETEPDTPADPAGSGAPGDISRANAAVTLVPVGPGSNQAPVVPCSVTVTPSGYAGEMEIVCDFANGPVNVYAVQVIVDGGYYSGSGEDALVIYDPSLGFTTGGGWFYWPDTTDKTNFGYTTKYNKKGRNVKGNLLLIRHLADGSIYRVKSNALHGLALGDTGAFSWASFSGKATYQEPGWPEPIGNHEFVVYVEDHDEPGAGADNFWIEVKKDGNVVALSMSLPAESNGETLEGGNIVVPHGDK